MEQARECLLISEAITNGTCLFSKDESNYHFLAFDLLCSLAEGEGNLLFVGNEEDCPFDIGGGSSRIGASSFTSRKTVFRPLEYVDGMM